MMSDINIPSGPVIKGVVTSFTSLCERMSSRGLCDFKPDSSFSKLSCYAHMFAGHLLHELELRGES
jgi:hypothetical protein